MGIAERRYRQKEEVKSLILETAWKQIQEEGVQSLSIRKVADAIEYSVPVIYAHFDSKEALIGEFVRRGFCLLTKMAKEARDAYEKPTAQLTAMALAYWEFAMENTEYYQLMFGLGIPTCEKAISVGEILTFGGLVKEAIQQAVRTGNHPDVDLELKFQSFWSILHGIVSIRLSHNCNRKEGDPDLGRAILEDTIKGYIYALVR